MTNDQRGGTNPKFEARNPKQIRIPKAERRRIENIRGIREIRGERPGCPRNTLKDAPERERVGIRRQKDEDRKTTGKARRVGKTMGAK